MIAVRSRVKNGWTQSQPMSTGSNANWDPPTGTTITLTREDDWWVATDEQTGVVSQGETRQAALENLDEALAGYHGEGEPPSEGDLRELGIDPERNTSGSLEDSELFD
jgi:predicted RNase H-like HicB family nuclease